MKIIYTFFIVVFLFMITGCQTIENKSQAAIKKENEKLSKFLQQPQSELKIVMGEPNEIAYDNKGSKFFVYTKKVKRLPRESVNNRSAKKRSLRGYVMKNRQPLNETTGLENVRELLRIGL